MRHQLMTLSDLFNYQILCCHYNQPSYDDIIEDHKKISKLINNKTLGYILFYLILLFG